MIVFKIDVWKRLKEKYNSYELNNSGLSGSTQQKLRKNEMVAIQNIDIICKLLQLQPGSIIKYIPDKEKE